MPEVLRRIESIVPRRAAEYGGKARGLAVLARAGFAVPAAYAMPGWVCESFLSSILPVEDRPHSLLQQAYLENDRLAEIAAHVRSATLPNDVTDAVVAALAQMRGDGIKSFAVRSSAVHEDQEGASSAGMHVTALNLLSDGEVLSAIKASWAGIFRPRTMAYLRAGSDGVALGVGVVLQAMVEAEVSGVMFTANPLTADAGEVVINASPGLGPMVADGRVSPDTFRIDKARGDVRDRVLGQKAMAMWLDSNGGTVERPLEAGVQRSFCLDDHQLRVLRVLAERLENHFGSLRDVEWSWANGELHVLQARPISGARLANRRGARKDGALPRSRFVWSNVNVGEALPGVVTPLTWSVLSRFSEVGFRRAFGALGCRVPRDAELVGDFRGRIYLNLTEFTTILSQIPWVHPATLVRLGGGQYLEELDDVVQDGYSKRFLLKLPQTVTRFVRENFQLQQRLNEFENAFQDERARFREVDFRILSPAGLARMLRDAEHLLDDTGSVMLTVYANLLSAVLLLAGIMRTFAKDDPRVTVRDLVSGLTRLESAEPGFELLEIAGIARAEPDALALIQKAVDSPLGISDLPDGPTRTALDAFVSKHGHRGIREGEIAAPRWREDPSLLFATIRSHVSSELDPRQRRRAQSRRREQAETELKRSMPIAVGPLVDKLLEVVRHFAQTREHLRSYVVDVLGVHRNVALEASRRIAVKEPEAGEGAAFFLTADELAKVLLHDRHPVAVVVQRRRVEHARNRSLADPPSTFVGFPPVEPAVHVQTDRLTGLAASGGVAEGRVRVLRDAGDVRAFRAGEVLVVPAADTGWSPLFLAAAAVVTELGGPLSHAAIVLREYAVPAVVNVRDATTSLRDGDYVRVDGDAGAVEVVDAPD